jgi:hypothetical protein
VAAVAVLLATAGVADAGTYTVVACEAAPGAVNHAWTPENSSVDTLEVADACGAGGEAGGLLAQDLLVSPFSALPGHEGSWWFEAPAGTAIVSLTYRRKLYTATPEWTAALREGAGAFVERGCLAPAPCPVGGPDSSPVTHTFDDTPRLWFGAFCQAGSCEPGDPAPGDAVQAVIYSAAVTLSDVHRPALSPASGEMAGGAWVSGSQALAFTASDVGGGVRWLRVVVGAGVVDAAEQPCDHTQRVPCPLTAGYDGVLDTRTVPDGVHELRLQAVDVAGNVTASEPVTVRIDNTPPVAATPQADGAPSPDPVRTIRLEPAPHDGFAPVVDRYVRLCRPGGVACGDAQLLHPRATQAIVILPEDGTWEVQTWDVDAAGNGSPATATSVTVRLERPQPAGDGAGGPGGAGTGGGQGGAGAADGPAGSTDRPAAARVSAGLKLVRPVVAKSRRSIAFKGTLARAATGKVMITVRARIGGKVRTVTRTVRVRNGRFTATVRLARGAWTKATAMVRYGGDRRYLPRTLTRTVTHTPKRPRI